MLPMDPDRVPPPLTMDQLYEPEALPLIDSSWDSLTVTCFEWNLMEGAGRSSHELGSHHAGEHGIDNKLYSNRTDTVCFGGIKASSLVVE